MDKVVIASNEADARAAEAVEQHHAQMAGTLAVRVEALLGAAAAGDQERAGTARAELASWCERELVPHALAEEKTMYPAAQAKPEGRLLVEGMLAEHTAIVGLVKEVADSADLVRAAAAAKALQVMFDSHLAKENELVLPLLVAAADVSVAELLGGMHELLGGEEAGHEHGHDHGATMARRAPSPPATPRVTPATAGRRTPRGTPSSTPGPSRTRSGTPRSSAPSTRCAPAAG